MTKADKLLQTFEKLLPSSDFHEYAQYRYYATVHWEDIIKNEELPDFLSMSRGSWTPEQMIEFNDLRNSFYEKYFNKIPLIMTQSEWAKEVAVAEAANRVSALKSEPRLMAFTTLKDGVGWSHHLYQTFGFGLTYQSGQE